MVGAGKRPTNFSLQPRAFRALHRARARPLPCTNSKALCVLSKYSSAQGPTRERRGTPCKYANSQNAPIASTRFPGPGAASRLTRTLICISRGLRSNRGNGDCARGRAFCDMPRGVRADSTQIPRELRVVTASGGGLGSVHDLGAVR